MSIDLSVILNDEELKTHELIGLGKTTATVLYIASGDYYIKVDRADSEFSLAQEYRVLSHLQMTPYMPELIGFDMVANCHVLRTKAPPGLPASDSHFMTQPERLVESLAKAARWLHKQDTEPHSGFDRSITRMLRLALNRAELGLVDMDDLDEARQGMALIELIAQLQGPRPENELKVVTHGDFCLPNVLLDPESFDLCGFVDLGWFGIADPYQDLALAQRSIGYNIGQEYEQLFFKVYGEELNKEKAAYYQLLDEFF